MLKFDYDDRSESSSVLLSPLISVSVSASFFSFHCWLYSALALLFKQSHFYNILWLINKVPLIFSNPLSSSSSFILYLCLVLSLTLSLSFSRTPSLSSSLPLSPYLPPFSRTNTLSHSLSLSFSHKHSLSIFPSSTQPSVQR